MSQQSPARPPDRHRSGARAVLTALAAAVCAGGLWALVTAALTAEARVAVGAAAAATTVLLAGAVYVAVRRSADLAAAEDDAHRAWAELHRAGGRLDAAREELALLVDHTLPAAVTRLREGATAETVLAEVEHPADAAHHRVLRTLVHEIAFGERRRAAATAACANAAGRVQALSTRTLADLRTMEDRCSDDMLGDLLRIDHSTAQTGRTADSIAVLTGARSGRRWTKPITMESVIRGAMGRIGAYQRVRVHSSSANAVAGYAAEDVMHALAELMDNATRFSAPSEEVHIYVEDLHNGAVITIEDGGLGMKPQALARAEAAVSDTQPLDMAMLSGTRLGLAVVGCLARKHRLHVFFRPSSRGGIGVVLRIPNHLITPVREEPFPEPVRRPAPVPAADPAPPGPGAHADQSELPKRPRGATLRAASAPLAPKETRAAVPRPDAGSRFGAFQQSRSRIGDPGGPPAAPPAAADDAT
ncbi:signal transduction histidine kinase [Murinocardiopsis flavida]|uniref:histidine kinase n=1 Tax=Murinocardiopsis flavida TaxID=645275 RepID=A0A2P8DKL0_9ACTN|nr:ATP-binding protein [Murinocardiopsis flavida]PSK97738.1 signal transduction histidine kinase [Murinocardiopsis flavida]